MKIAVIGAGLAGVTAASTLQSRGYRVELFEKSRGFGGRLATRRLDWGQVDIGAQYFTVRSDDFAKAVEGWQAAGIVVPWEFTPHSVVDGQLRVSPDETRRYIAVPAMNTLAKATGAGLSCHFQRRIEHLAGGPGAWWLLDDKRQSAGPYQWVILTLPAAQSKTLLLTHPEASCLAQAIAGDPLQPSWALALATRGNIDPAIAGIFGDQTVSWVSRLNQKPGRETPPGCDDLWLLHFGARWSMAHGKAYAAQVPQVGCDWLQQHLACSLEIRHRHVHFWRYAKPRQPLAPSTPLVDSDQGVAVIGDWTWGGRIEGAYLSAMHLVQQQFD